MPPDAGTWWTVPEAAGYLKVSENAVYAAIRAGQIPVVHIGTQPRVSPLALVQFAVERARHAQLLVSDQITDRLAAIQSAPTAAPTPVGTDRLRPKHIGTASRRAGNTANGE
jgi:excisionase family DNA binding protein